MLCEGMLLVKKKIINNTLDSGTCVTGHPH